jgi:CRISPR/Cas system-associated endonuclease Cas1
MKFLKSKGFILAIVLTLALPVLAFAQTDEDSATEQNNKTKVTDVIKKKWDHKRDHIKLGVHKAMYFQLLAEKYTEDQLADWEEVLEERKNLMEQLKELKASKKEEMKSTYKEEMNKLREKVKSGELTKEEAHAKMKEKFSDFKAKHDLDGKHEKHHELMKEFNDAIASNNEEKIKETLPKVLEVFKAQNEHLKEVIESFSN